MPVSSVDGIAYVDPDYGHRLTHGERDVLAACDMAYIPGRMSPIIRGLAENREEWCDRIEAVIKETLVRRK